MQTRRFHYLVCFVVAVFWATFCCGETVPLEFGVRNQITVEQDEPDDLPLPNEQTHDPFLNHLRIVFSASSASTVEGRTNKVSKDDLPLCTIGDKNVHLNRCSFTPCGETGRLYEIIRPHLLFQHLLI